MVACGTYFAEPDTILVFTIFYGLFKGGRRRKWKEWILIPLYGQTKLCAPTNLIKLAYLPSAAVNGVVGLPTPVLMRIP